MLNIYFNNLWAHYCTPLTDEETETGEKVKYPANLMLPQMVHLRSD